MRLDRPWKSEWPEDQSDLAVLSFNPSADSRRWMDLTDGRVGKNRVRFAHRTKIPRDLPTGHLSPSRSAPCYQDPSAPAIVADRRSARRRFSAPCGPYLLPDSGYFPGAPLLVLPGCCCQHNNGFAPAAASGSLAAPLRVSRFPGASPLCRSAAFYAFYSRAETLEHSAPSAASADRFAIFIASPSALSRLKLSIRSRVRTSLAARPYSGPTAGLPRRPWLLFLSAQIPSDSG